MEKKRKDRFDTLMALANYWDARFKARMGYQWTVSLAFWGLIALATYRIPSKPHWSVLVVAFVVILGIYSCLWLREIAWRNEKERGYSQHYLELARAYAANEKTDLTQKPSDPEDWYWWYGFLYDGIALAELATTFFLLVWACAYAGSGPLHS